MLELYRQATVPHTAIDPSNNMPYETSTFSAEKFAQLIVQKCINKHRELIAKLSKPADGYEHTFPEFVEGVVHGLTEGIEGIEELFEVTVQG